MPNVNNPGQVTPLPWRKHTPLHKTLGARSMSFYYGNGVGAPILGAATGGINLRYDATTGLDRIIGFCLSIQKQNVAFEFYLQELNTFWQLDYSYSSNRGLFVQANLETLPDEVNLNWTFSAQPTGNVYLAFYNVEVPPVVIA